MLIDITRQLDRAMRGRIPTGVDRVGNEYARHFRDRAQALVRFGGRWLVLSSVDSARLLDALTAPGPDFPSLVRRCVARRYLTPGNPGLRSRLLLNTGHSGLDLPEYPRRIRTHDLRPVFFLHDLIPITHPEYCRPGEAERHRRRLETMLALGRGLILNSQATCEVLSDFAARLGRPLPPLLVAPLAPGRLPDPARERPLERPYFVMLGTIEPRKNHWLILHLWRDLAETLGPAAPRLVVIGQRGWECEQVVDLLDRCEPLRGLVSELPGCSDAELATWLRHAQALLFPTFMEGFGIPLVEALMLGLPVLTSDLPVFHEIAGDIPEYLDPLDGAGWKRAILEYTKPDSVRRQAQCDRLREFRPVAWDEHLAAVDGWLDAMGL